MDIAETDSMPKYSLQKQNSTISFEIQLPQRQAVPL